MDDRTYTASTQDWIKSTEGMRITAYVDARPVPTTDTEDHTFTRGDFEAALKKASRRVQPSRPERETSGTSA